VRQKLGTTQAEFALMIGVSVSTLRNWEQGRRTPDGPALACSGKARNPQAVAEALHAPRRREWRPDGGWVMRVSAVKLQRTAISSA
jgi:putative transcriptional regulator